MLPSCLGARFRLSPDSIGIHSHGSKEDIHHGEFLFSFLFPAGKSRILEQDYVFLPGPRLACQAAGLPRRVRHQRALGLRADRVSQRAHGQCAGEVRRENLVSFVQNNFYVEPRVACHAGSEIVRLLKYLNGRLNVCVLKER